MKKETQNAFNTKSWNKKSWSKNKYNKIPSLIRSGNMKNSLKITPNFNDKSIKVSGVDYTEYQNFGTRTIPQRQFIGVSDELVRKTSREAKKIIKNNISKLMYDMFNRELKN